MLFQRVRRYEEQLVEDRCAAKNLRVDRYAVIRFQCGSLNQLRLSRKSSDSLALVSNRDSNFLRNPKMAASHLALALICHGYAEKSRAIRSFSSGPKNFLTNLRPRCKLLSAHSPSKIVNESGGTF
jgi:hypothetical protein